MSSSPEPDAPTRLDRSTERPPGPSPLGPSPDGPPDDGLERQGAGGRAQLPARPRARGGPGPEGTNHDKAAPTPAASSPDGSATDGSATAALWRRRAIGTSAVAYAVALTGIDRIVLGDALSISLAASAEAGALLDGMELRVRTLTTSVETQTERCVNSVRGPVLWSETLTARANALGNDDVFVCATPSRSFDTVENRVLVAALEAIAKAGKAIAGPTGDKVAPEEAARIAGVAEEARRWRRHHRLIDVRSTRLNGRDLVRLRSGHRSARMLPVIAIRDRVAEPFVAEDLNGLSDRWTQRYHAFVAHTLGAMMERFDEGDTLIVHEGGLWSGATSFRHPAAPGETPAGLCHRGIPLLPRPELVDGAPWAHELPGDGVRIASDGDLRRLLDRLSDGPLARRSRGGSAGR